MTDIIATKLSYMEACQSLRKTPNAYIVKMLDRVKNQVEICGDDEMKDTMDLYLAGNNQLLTKERLTDDDCMVLCKALNKNLFIVSLDLRYNNITDEGAKYIGTLLKASVALMDLNLMCNDIGEEGAGYIAEALRDNESLISLRMNGNKIGNRGGMYFAQVLQVNTTLEALDLGDTDQRTESIIALSTVLYQNHSIKTININRPILFTEQEETTVHWANLLRVNTTLEQLHMQKCSIRDFGAARLAENLLENNSLHYLDLSCNRITRDGVKHLSLVLHRNTALQVLDLGYNRMEDDGARCLASALGTMNFNLKILVIVYNNIKGDGLCAIANSLKNNVTLQKIFIWGNILEESACIAFHLLFQTGRLTLEDTDVKPYTVDDVAFLAEQNNRIRRHYYWAPSYGNDVPSWQPRGPNPRGGGPPIQYEESTLDDLLVMSFDPTGQFPFVPKHRDTTASDTTVLTMQHKYTVSLGKVCSMMVHAASETSVVESKNQLSQQKSPRVEDSIGQFSDLAMSDASAVSVNLGAAPLNYDTQQGSMQNLLYADSESDCSCSQ